MQKAGSGTQKELSRLLNFKNYYNVVLYTHSLNPQLLRGRLWTNPILSLTHTHTTLCQQFMSSLQLRITAANGYITRSYRRAQGPTFNILG